MFRLHEYTDCIFDDDGSHQQPRITCNGSVIAHKKQGIFCARVLIRRAHETTVAINNNAAAAARIVISLIYQLCSLAPCMTPLHTCLPCLSLSAALGYLL